MRCRKVVHDLPLLAGGDLEPGQAALVREHLGRCFACARVFASEVGVRDALASVAWDGERPDPVIPGVDEEFFVRMQEEIVAEVAESATPSTSAFRAGRSWLVRRRFWFGGGFAAASVLFVIGFVLGGGLRWPAPADPLHRPLVSGRPHEIALPFDASEPMSNSRSTGRDSQVAEPFLSDRPMCGEDADASDDRRAAEDGNPRRLASRPFVVPLRGEPRDPRR